MKFAYMILVILFSLCILPTSESFSQDDPGEPDTVKFGKLSIYLTGPPYRGKAIIPLVVFNDEPVSRMDIPLIWTGPLWGDSSKFVDERADYLIWSYIGFSNEEKKMYVLAVAGHPIEPPYMPPGDGDFVHLYFSVLDTGFVSIDTSFLPWQDYGFLDTLARFFLPIFLRAEFYISPTLVGDINGDGVANIGDAVFLINYLFREGPPPDFPEQGDLNGDCIIDVGDVVYLLNYLYKEGPPPLMCSY